MENTYVVYSEEYYFSMNTFSSVLKKNVYNVTYNEDSASEVKNMIEDTLQKTVEAGDINANNEMLTTFEVKVIPLEGKYSIEDAKKMVVNGDYTWGRSR